MSSKYHVNPRIRAYGKARIDVTLRASDEAEWQSMWRNPLNPFPFTWGEDWMICCQYMVYDFAAEVGFYIDILGFDVRAFSPSYGQFIDPEHICCLSVTAVPEGIEATDPDTIRLQLHVQDIDQTVLQLEKRGIVFEQKPILIHEGSSIKMGYFRTPHGVCIDLFGEIIINEDEDDYPHEDEVDEEEADRLIKEILGLSEDEDDIEEDDDYPTEDEFVQDNLDEEDSSEESTEESSPKIAYTDLPAHKTLVTPVRKNNQPLPIHSTRNLSRNDRNGSSTWPSQNDRKLNEPTYHKIEDESESIENI